MIYGISTSYLLESRPVFFVRQKCFLLDNFWESDLHTWNPSKCNFRRYQKIISLVAERAANKIQLARITVVSGCTHLFTRPPSFSMAFFVWSTEYTLNLRPPVPLLGPGLAQAEIETRKPLRSTFPRCCVAWEFLEPEMVWNGWPAANGVEGSRLSFRILALRWLKRLHFGKLQERATTWQPRRVVQRFQSLCQTESSARLLLLLLHEIGIRSVWQMLRLGAVFTYSLFTEAALVPVFCSTFANAFVCFPQAFSPGRGAGQTDIFFFHSATQWHQKWSGRHLYFVW